MKLDGQRQEEQYNRFLESNTACIDMQAKLLNIHIVIVRCHQCASKLYNKGPKRLVVSRQVQWTKEQG